MSDIFEGPGWWMASDGKWYPPHLHADASYRARWVNVEPTVAAPDTSQSVLVAEAPAAAPTSITAPTESSWLPEQPSSRPIADVPPQSSPAPFVPSDKVAERAAALSDTARQEPAVVESPTEPPASAPVAESPAAAVPVVEPASMPEPVVAPMEAPVPLTNGADAGTHTPAVEEAEAQPDVTPAGEASDSTEGAEGTDGAEGYVAFGGPSSTPVSEILSRIDHDATATNGSSTNGAAVVDTETDTAAEVDTTDAEPDMAITNGAAAAEPDVAPVRVGPSEASSPAAPPIEFEPAKTNGRANESTETEGQPSRARLEVGTPTQRGEERFGLLTPNQPSEHRIQLQEQPRISTSTDLVPVRVPEVVTYSDGPSLHDRIVASVLFLSGVAMIVGTFLVWTTSPDLDVTGWEINDGIATIIAGVLGSAAAGPIFVGFRHIVPKTLAILSGLVGIIVPGLRGLEALSDSALAETGVGAGFWIVFGGAIAMLLAGVADQSRFGD